MLFLDSLIGICGILIITIAITLFVTFLDHWKKLHIAGIFLGCPPYLKNVRGFGVFAERETKKHGSTKQKKEEVRETRLATNALEELK